MAKKQSKRTTARRVQATENEPFELPQITAKPEIDEDEWFDKSELTIRESQFVKAYIGPAAGNGAKAARLAGYSDSNENSLRATASRLLTRANIQRALGLELARQRTSPEWVAARLGELAGSHFANVSKLDEQGEIRFDSQTAIDNGALGQIKEIKEEIIKVGDSPAQVIKRTVKMHDPSGALNSLAKMHGMLVDRHDLTSGGKPVVMQVLRGVSTDDL